MPIRASSMEEELGKTESKGEENEVSKEYAGIAKEIKGRRGVLSRRKNERTETNNRKGWSETD